MLEIQIAQLNKLIDLAHAMGATVAVRTKDGQDLGDSLDAFNKRHTRRNHYASRYDFTVLSSMVAGDVHEFVVEADDSLNGFQSVLCGHAQVYFGKGCYTTHQASGRRVQILRTE